MLHVLDTFIVILIVRCTILASFITLYFLCHQTKDNAFISLADVTARTHTVFCLSVLFWSYCRLGWVWSIKRVSAAVAQPTLLQLCITPLLYTVSGNKGAAIFLPLNLPNAETIFGRPCVKRFALCYRTVVLSLPCLSVTLVYCSQTVGRIKMKLGMQVGLGPGHIVLGGDPAAPPPKGHSPPNFRPISVPAKWLHGSRCHLVWS